MNKQDCYCTLNCKVCFPDETNIGFLGILFYSLALHLQTNCLCTHGGNSLVKLFICAYQQLRASRELFLAVSSSNHSKLSKLESLQSVLLFLTWRKHKPSDYLDLALSCSHDVFNVMICTLSKNLTYTMTWFVINQFETIPYTNKFAIDWILKFLSVIYKFSQYTRSTKKKTIEQGVS